MSSRDTVTFLLQVWLSLFGLIAALASFRNGWKATALPPPLPTSTLAVASNTQSAADSDNVANRTPDLIVTSPTTPALSSSLEKELVIGSDVTEKESF